MINGNINNSPVRSVKGKVELYEGSTLLDTYTYRDRLINFTVERVGEGNKFFGFGICQKINIHVIDKDRELNITTANSFKAYLTTDEEYITPFPEFHVTEVHRDENTNELSITAYDKIYIANGVLCGTSDLGNTALLYLAKKCANKIGLPTVLEDFGGTGIMIPQAVIETVNIPEDDMFFTLQYPEGYNLEGTETIREILDDIAEVTQSIYYLNNESHLTFKRLDRDGEAVINITKSDYFTLDSKTNRRLGAIGRATQLGNNKHEPEVINGTIQYAWDNSLWEMREDIDTLLINAWAAIGGLTINQFECSWRGNFLSEPGDKIALTTKDDKIVYSYLLNDVVTYDGSLGQESKWAFEREEEEVPSNPTTLGERLKQTFARVDKQNGRIEQVASEVGTNAENIASLQISTEEINAKVVSVEEASTEAIGAVASGLATLEQSVETKMTDEQVSIKITEALANGVDKVETSTGFKFDETGLTISKSDSELSTTITEDGMTIKQGTQEVLITDNIGVQARNLHATTYLIIGNNSRFEDYGSDRTGCFWIGG